MEKFKNFSPQELADKLDKPKKGSHWGYHLLFDGSDCNEKINDVKVVEQFLKELVKALDMKPIGDPMVVKVTGEEARGVSALQLITTSNIAFHGDDENWCVYIDVFSCKEYDPKIAIRLINKYFEPKYYGTKWIFRDAGKWPHKK